MIDAKRLHLPHLRKPGPKPADHPTIGSAEADMYFNDDESEFIVAVTKFRSLNRVNSPTLCQLLWVLKQLGYHKGESNGPIRKVRTNRMQQ